MAPIDEAKEQAILGVVIDSEYKTAKSNWQPMFDTYQSHLDMFDGERGERDYDWMSDLTYPEFQSIMLTQLAMDVQTYFKTRDFCEVYLQEDSDEAMAAAAAAKECINRTLNQRELHHYLKYVRSKEISNLHGPVVSECRWVKRYKTQLVAVEIDEETEEQTPVYEDVLCEDRFDYDVYDPRNVFTDNNYTYSLQEKGWVELRSLKTFSQLEADKDDAGYFGLDRIKTHGGDPEATETAQDTTNKDDGFAGTKSPGSESFEVIKRYGPLWCIVEKTNPVSGLPIKVSPGWDEAGEPVEGAELVECVMEVAMSAGGRWVIAFHQTPYVTVRGNTYRPIVRGLCYPHPNEDFGFGDGRHCKDLQDALNDTLNMSNDRTRLSTTPTIAIRRYSNEANDTIYFEPGHAMEVDDPSDLHEFRISDDIAGAMNQMSLLRNKMQELTSVYPTTMGNMPDHTSVTATAVAGAQQQTGIRTSFKSMTFEYTYLTEFYWLILQMTARFAEPETGLKLMGDRVYDFDPEAEYFFKPLSQTIEAEQSKMAKIQRFEQLIGMLVNFPHQDAIKVINALMVRIMQLMGDEEAQIAKMLMDPEKPMLQEAGAPPAEAVGGPVASNQNGVPQSLAELDTREFMGAVSR